MNDETKERFYKAIQSLPQSVEIPEDITQTSAEPKPRNQTHEDLKQLSKEIHSISQELKKLNNILSKKR
jgi:peptidoglycan hydrolase CwlO-like protein